MLVLKICIYTVIFSLLDGHGQIENYALRIPQINQKYLCITDHGMMGAIPRQLRACDVMGIQPILGMEMYLNNKHIPKSEMEGLSTEEKAEIGKNYHLLSLAYTSQGYSNLVQLSSQAWLQFYKKPRVTYAQIDKFKEGIIFTSSCYIGEIGQAFDRYGSDRAEEELKRYIKWFSPNFYLEMLLLDFKKQRAYNEWLVKMHIKYRIPAIISCDCLVEGSVILTDRGVKFIENIEVGDKVLTHNNRFRKVEFVNKRPLANKEAVYRVKSSLGTYAWEATGNHLVRVANVKTVGNKLTVIGYDWKRVDELTKKDYLVVPKIAEKQVFSNRPLKEIDLLKLIHRKDYFIKKSPNGSRNGNYACSLIYDKEEKCFKSYRGFDQRSEIKVPRFLKLDNDFLKILGLYMAEGGLDKAGTVVSFGLHSRELVEKDLIFRYFAQFGIVPTVAEKGDGVKVYFSSKLFKLFFAKICGEGCLNKHFPYINNKVFKVFSKEQIKTIIGQYWKGDGTFPEQHERATSVTSVSKVMIYELAAFINALGFPVIPCRGNRIGKHKNPNAKPNKWNISYYLNLGANVKVRFLNLMYDDNKPLEGQRKILGKYIVGDDCYAVKVFKISKINYNKLVYNLQVEEDESYVANFYQVHNCHYCRKEDSKYQRYMLMIRNRKTIHDFQNMEDGAEYFELQDENLWLKSEEELDEKYLKREKDGFSYSDIIPPEIYTQAKLNTIDIAKKASGVEIDKSIKLPQMPNADAKLKEAIVKGYKWRGLGNNKTYLKRLQEEYELICKKGFASYFIIQQEIVQEARRVCPEILGWGNGDEAIGPGRGSVCGSLICYCLGITDIDPIHHDLLFSRFLSDARGGREMKTRFSDIPIPEET